MVSAYAKSLVKFLYEAGSLKAVPRSGWQLCGIKCGESVADHCFRTALIAHALAKKMKLDTQKVLLMALFHDLHESRTGDTNKVSARYIGKDSAERKAVKEQASDYSFITEYAALMEELTEGRSKEAVAVKDADYLECAIQAKEYIEQGYTNAQDWLEKSGKRLALQESREIFKMILNTGSEEWWKGLKKL
jgi:putative hydrolase of HD superfamily